jgi:hypothetical protein
MGQAFAENRSFYFSVEGTAVDSYVATGLMRAESGVLQRFWYDSAPCGVPVPTCPERLLVADCETPANPGKIDPFLECSRK